MTIHLICICDAGQKTPRQNKLSYSEIDQVSRLSQSSDTTSRENNSITKLAFY